MHWTGFRWWLGDVVLLRPPLSLFPGQHEKVAFLDDVFGTVFPRKSMGRHVNAYKLVKIMFRPQGPLAGSKDLGSAAVQGAGFAGPRSRVGADLDLFDPFRS
jgi:hypothetical protein